MLQGFGYDLTTSLWEEVDDVGEEVKKWRQRYLSYGAVVTPN